MIENSSKEKRVAVAMSGGVDSSVAAALLLRQGYKVVGFYMQLWRESEIEGKQIDGTAEAAEKACQVADRLGISLEVVDGREVFHQRIVKAFIESYQNGLTPNPCVMCNREIKWGWLLEFVQAQGFDQLATGHYARMRIASNKVELLKGKDLKKDQSYMLCGLTQAQLRRAILPLGDYCKKQVRELALEMRLPSAEQAESQDLCFISDAHPERFLGKYLKKGVSAGEIVNSTGEVIGEHQGLAFYTIGQRKGIRIPAPHPLYVLEKDLATNRLIVGTIDELGKDRLWIKEMNWISGKKPALPIMADVKIRYQAEQVPAEIKDSPSGVLEVIFRQAMRDITPGQIAALYQGDVCLGGGIILTEVEK